MYAASLVLLLVAIITLAVGFVQGGVVLVFVSIGASAAAAILLSGWVLRRPAPQPATAGASLPPDEGMGETGGSGAAPVATLTHPGERPPTGEVPGRRPSWSPRIPSEVVAIAVRGTYHSPGCRLVEERLDVERMTSEAAKHRGYSACGVCRPE